MSLATRRLGALRAAAGLAHGLLLVPGWLCVPRGSAAASARERRFLHRIARQLVKKIERTGAEPGGPGTLYVSNHISWMDIPILGAALDTDFIAKSEVMAWPVIGRLARRSGTLFVARDERHRVHRQADAIGARLRGGRSLLLFAEGTTSDGLAILPFRSSLFQAAANAARIQPLAIGYHQCDGARLSDDQMRAIGWTGDEELLPNLAQVSRLCLNAEIRLAPAFTPDAGLSRKALAERCRIAVVETYAAIRSG